MFVTSSRKPSAKTRNLCKRLSPFIGRYVNRGKISMRELLKLAEGESFIVVGEYHGNPGELVFYGKNGQLLFSLRFAESFAESGSQSIDSDGIPEVEPLFAGKGDVANALADFFPFRRVAYDKIEEVSKGSIMMIIQDQNINFTVGEKSLFRFKLKGFKRYFQ